MQRFVAFCEENKDKPLSFFDKTSFTDAEKVSWQAEFRRRALFRTHVESKQLWKDYKDLLNRYDRLNEEYKKLKKTANRSLKSRIKRRVRKLLK